MNQMAEITFLPAERFHCFYAHPAVQSHRIYIHWPDLPHTQQKCRHHITCRLSQNCCMVINASFLHIHTHTKIYHSVDFFKNIAVFIIETFFFPIYRHRSISVRTRNRFSQTKTSYYVRCSFSFYGSFMHNQIVTKQQTHCIDAICAIVSVQSQLASFEKSRTKTLVRLIKTTTI